uniref:Uncharacterized protein n=1 Tax=Arundo donax TaxID=35708 RepID=A0A0A9GY59_ARUDO
MRSKVSFAPGLTPAPAVSRTRAVLFPHSNAVLVFPTLQMLHF